MRVFFKRSTNLHKLTKSHSSCCFPCMSVRGPIGQIKQKIQGKASALEACALETTVSAFYFFQKKSEGGLGRSVLALGPAVKGVSKLRGPARRGASFSHRVAGPAAWVAGPAAPFQMRESGRFCYHCFARCSKTVRLMGPARFNSWLLTRTVPIL